MRPAAANAEPECPVTPPDSVESGDGKALRPGDAFWFIDKTSYRDTLEERVVGSITMGEFRFTGSGFVPAVEALGYLHQPRDLFRDREAARAAYDEHLRRSFEAHQRLAAHYRARLEALRAGQGHGDVIVSNQAVS